MKRKVFFVSDHTGLTVEAMARSLLSQFPEFQFEMELLNNVVDERKAELVRRRIARAVDECERPPVVFSTLVRPEMRAILKGTGAQFFDFFEAFTPQLEAAFGMSSVPKRGQYHGKGNARVYDGRIDAVHFALDNDDGSITRHYEQAQLILVGVSRTGKTPTCLYLGLQYGIRAANYPLTEEDETTQTLPAALRTHRAKLFGLTIDPEQLARIRKERRPHGRYAEPEQCQLEVERAENLFRRHAIPYVDTSAISIEEIAAKILEETGLQPKE